MTTIRSPEADDQSSWRPLKLPQLLLLASCLALGACGQTDDMQTPAGVAADSRPASTRAVPTIGKTTYNRWCISCHLSGVSGAPRLARAEDWGARLPKGRDTMLANLKKGIGAMPPRGLCSSCSDEELEMSLDYMLETLQP